MPEFSEVVPNVFMLDDSCNVYLLRDGFQAVAIDFGSGSVLDLLDALEVRSVTDILMTHHHRDQAQGLGRAFELGIRIWVPPVERELFESVNEHWQSRTLDNNYDLLEDKFSLLESVPVTGTAQEYARRKYGGWELFTLPTPGHTVGSVSYLAELDGRRLAFVGDLIYGVGKVWSLASMQWTYGGLEGAAATIASLRGLREFAPDVLLPSHGLPIQEPLEAIEQVSERLQELLMHRPSSRLYHLEAPELAEWTEHPYERVTEHLLTNRTSQAISYVLLSKDGAALMFDYGYDMCPGRATTTARYARRPWLASLEALRRDYGVSRIEAVIPTHYHDDHVAGFNLLRESQVTEVWAGENIAPVISDPRRFDLPCLWFDPIRVDRVLPLGEEIRWHEYELTLHELSGHTLYAVAIAFDVDGQRVVATGDQQDGGWRCGEQSELLNYQYMNGFRIDDFVKSAELYREISPDLMISGHWAPRAVTGDYLDALLDAGQNVARLHRELLPLDDVNFGARGVGARIEPYRSLVEAGSRCSVMVTMVNPFGRRAELRGVMVVPGGWQCTPTERRRDTEPNEMVKLEFTIQPGPSSVRRARIAVNMTAGGVRFGQQAEGLVDVVVHTS